MNCNEFQSLLQQETVQGLTPAQQEHIDRCNACRLLYSVRRDCRMLDSDDEVPASFKAGWRREIQKEDKTMQPKKRMNTALKKWIAVAAMFVVLISGTLVTSNYLANKSALSTQYDAGEMANYASESSRASMPVPFAGTPEMGTGEVQGKSLSSLQAVPDKNAKIIRTVSITLTTRNFDADVLKIKTLLNDQKGYMENSQISTDYRNNRTANFTMRIPTDVFGTFTDNILVIGHTTSVSESAEDVSENYTDTESRLETQKTKLKRLQAMIEKAVSVEELLQIESSIADTQYQLDSLNRTLQGYDNRINYSTLYLSVEEQTDAKVVVSNEASLGERIISAAGTMWKMMLGFIKDMIVFVVVIAPLAIVLLGVVLVIRKIKRRKAKK